MTDQPLRLLLVEDEEAHAELISRAFEEVDGAGVTRVERLSHAKELLANGARSYDLVVTDLRLPDGLGTELLDGDESPPVVILTSQGDEKAAVAAMKAGALDYVVKSENTFADMPRISERVVREWNLLREQRRLKKALAARERLAAVGTAAAMLAHEIGNPLNSMRLQAELLQRRLKKLDIDDERVWRSLNNCASEIQRLADLLGDFRALSRQLEVYLVSVDVGDFVRGVVSRYEPAIADSNIDLNVVVPDDLGIVKIDPDKMTQVLLNLLKNAAEAMPDGGSMRVEVTRSRQCICLHVSDTGCGVPAEIDVFEPFKSTKSQGSGLGLPIVQRIVAAHSGTISHEPNQPHGTHFKIVLPVA